MIVQWICHVVNKCIFSLISVFNQFYLILFNFIFCLFIIMRFYIYVMSAAWMYSRKTAPKHDLFHFRNDMSTARTLRSCLIGKMLMPKEICNLVHHCFKNTQTHRTTKKKWWKIWSVLNEERQWNRGQSSVSWCISEIDSLRVIGNYWRMELWILSNSNSQHSVKVHRFSKILSFYSTS